MTETFSRPIGAAPLMHVAVLCEDVDKSLAFYRDGLGFSARYEWTKSTSETGQVVYDARGVYLELGGHTYMELFPGGSADVDSSSGPMHHIAIIVPDVDEAYRKCLASGGREFPMEAWTGEPASVVLNGEPEVKCRVAFIKGPSGELIELYDQRGPIHCSIR